jgi:hypothetical protein
LMEIVAGPNRSYVVLKYSHHAHSPTIVSPDHGHNLATVVYKVLEALKKRWPGGLGSLLHILVPMCTTEIPLVNLR